MADIRVLRKLLAEEYGIRTDRELNEAIRKMMKLDIGVFASPVARKDGKENGKERCIA